MNVRIKLIGTGKAPERMTAGAAGLDCYVRKAERFTDEVEKVRYSLGFAIEIPPGHCGLIFPRSSAHKKMHLLSNSVGLIDSDYRGEVTAVFYAGEADDVYKPGERCCQLLILPYPSVELQTVEKLTETERGAGGYGSTGN